MGKRGPQPQPKISAKAKGVYRPSRHEDQVATVGDKMQWVHNGIPNPPEDLDDFAKALWLRQLGEAQKIFGWISFIDLALFREYCYVASELEKLKDLSINRTYEDKKGVRRLDPLYAESNKLRTNFIRLSQEFGFSPSARTRIKLEQQDNKPKVDEYNL